jgi:hypothetical protein
MTNAPTTVMGIRCFTFKVSNLNKTCTDFCGSFSWLSLSRHQSSPEFLPVYPTAPELHPGRRWGKQQTNSSTVNST